MFVLSLATLFLFWEDLFQGYALPQKMMLLRPLCSVCGGAQFCCDLLGHACITLPGMYIVYCQPCMP